MQGTTMIATIETGSPKVVGFRLSGKLHDEDYQQFVPTMETILTARGKCGFSYSMRISTGGTCTPPGTISSSVWSIIPTSSGLLWLATASGKSGWLISSGPLPWPRLSISTGRKPRPLGHGCGKTMRAVKPWKKLIGHWRCPRKPTVQALGFGTGFNDIHFQA